eukprot:762559-Pleurochrysis_carterae.AAC.2
MQFNLSAACPLELDPSRSSPRNLHLRTFFAKRGFCSVPVAPKRVCVGIRSSFSLRARFPDCQHLLAAAAISDSTPTLFCCSDRVPFLYELRMHAHYSSTALPPFAPLLT